GTHEGAEVGRPADAGSASAPVAAPTEQSEEATPDSAQKGVGLRQPEAGDGAGPSEILAEDPGAKVSKPAEPVVTLVIDKDQVHRLLGREQFRNEQAERIDRPGVATGLVWTPVGGDIIFVEAARTPSREEHLVLTGQLGEVMKESVQAALTCV